LHSPVGFDILVKLLSQKIIRLHFSHEGEADLYLLLTNHIPGDYSNPASSGSVPLNP